MKNLNITIPHETIIGRIFLVRGKKVMLDKDLAEIYDVETKELKRAVKRNHQRFPVDFMFELSKEEFENLRYQFGTSSWGGQRYRPYAFTEQGVAMLSAVLHSQRAVQASIQIVRTFIKLREILSDNKRLAHKIEKMERTYDKHIFGIYEAIKKLALENKRRVVISDTKNKDPIGFRR